MKTSSLFEQFRGVGHTIMGGEGTYASSIKKLAQKTALSAVTVLMGCTADGTPGTVEPTPRPTWVWTPEHGTAPTPSPTATPTATPAPSTAPRPQPTGTPEATPEPTALPTEEPEATPSPEPTATPTPEATPSAPLGNPPTFHTFYNALTEGEWEHIGVMDETEKLILLRALEQFGHVLPGLGTKLYMNYDVLRGPLSVHFTVEPRSIYPTTALVEQWTQEAVTILKDKLGIQMITAATPGDAQVHLRLGGATDPGAEHTAGRVYQTVEGHASALLFDKGVGIQGGYNGYVAIDTLVNGLGICKEFGDAMKVSFQTVFVHELLHALFHLGHLGREQRIVRDLDRPTEKMQGIMVPSMVTNIEHEEKKGKGGVTTTTCKSVDFEGEFRAQYRELAYMMYRFIMLYAQRYPQFIPLEGMQETGRIVATSAGNHGLCTHTQEQEQTQSTMQGRLYSTLPGILPPLFSPTDLHWDAYSGEKRMGARR